jgi:integrase
VPQKFTDITVNTLPIPPSGRKTYWEHPLGVRVTPNGVRSYIVITKDGQRKTLGRVGVLSLKEARLEAVRIKAEYQPTKYKAPPVRLSEARTRYLAAITVRPPTRLYYERFLAELPDLPLADIDHTHIVRVLDRHTPSQAYVALRTYSAFFRWAIPRYIKYSPCTGLKVPTLQSRSRVLSDDELRAIYHAALSMGTYGQIVICLMLTGLRRNEASLIEKQWISKQSDTWLLSLPAHVCKNGRDHCIPLGGTSAALLTKLITEQPSASARIFSRKTGTSKAFISWSRPKQNLDRACGVTDWTLHDLRRTYAVCLQRCGANLQTIEKLLNHVSGSFAGIVGTYQRYDFQSEMRAAVQRYDDWFCTTILIAPT